MRKTGTEGHIRATRIGVLTPATNLTVERELRDMAIASVDVATARIPIAQTAWTGPGDLQRFVAGVTEQIPPTALTLIAAVPDILMLGIASSPLWDGVDGNRRVKEATTAATGLSMVTPVDAFTAAFERLGVRRIGVITPYPAVADEKVVEFFDELGVETLAQRSLRCASANGVGQVSDDDIIGALRAVHIDGVEAIVQLGTDLRTARVAAQAELWMGLPVLAANSTTWWHTLRSVGVHTRLPGWGCLLEQH